MKFESVYWPDSNVEKIIIEYDKAMLLIQNDLLQKKFSVICTGLAGITNLCIWDDTIIMSASVYPVCNTDDEFIRNLYAVYSKDMDYGGRSLDEGLLELRIELANYLAFSVFCQKIDVIECDT